MALLACRREAALRRDGSVARPLGSLVLESDPGRLVVRKPPKMRRHRVFRDSGIDAALELLRERDEIAAPMVGVGAGRSTFFRLADAHLPMLARADVDWLLEDDHPAVRAFGLTAATLLGDSSQLIAHVCDRDLVIHRNGCVGSRQTIGAVARALFEDPHWLGAFAPLPRKPLRGELAALEARIVATDGCQPELPPRLVEELGWDELRYRAPGVPTWVLAKALGRSADPKVGQLAHVLDDAGASPGARVSAASGLTRSAKAEAEAAILRNAAFLDGIRVGLSRELRATIRARRTVEALVAPIRAVHTTGETEKLAANALEALSIESMAVLDAVLDPTSYGVEDERVLGAKVTALRWVLDHASLHEACWDTYRDTPYVLARHLSEDRLVRLGISWVEARAIEARVAKLVDRLDESPCP